MATVKRFRYPEDLLLIQAQLYQAYHMDAAEVFYNREDLWQFPRQPGDAGTAVMAPYYIIMRLPGEPQAEFFLISHRAEPPRQHDRVAGGALRPARLRKADRLRVSQGEACLRPFQIEARINQNTDISNNSRCGTNWARG